MSGGDDFVVLLLCCYGFIVLFFELLFLTFFWVTPSKKVPKEASKDASARVLICAHGSL